MYGVPAPLISTTVRLGSASSFGECVTVFRRAYSRVGVVHARYRFRNDALAALQA